MKKIMQEFKEFAVKGNAIELATAVIIGAAFGKIISSLVADIIMPVVSLLTGGGSFSDWKITLQQAVGSRPATVLNIGIFLQNIVDFLIIAASIFLFVKLLAKLKEQMDKNKLEKEKIAPEPPITKDQELLVEIRDLLKK